MISNQDRLNLIRNFCEDDLENEVENVLKNILENGSNSLKSMIKLFDLMDNSSSVESDLQVSYSIGNRTIEVINTCEQLENVMNSIELTPFIGFDSEQKPTFKKGQADNGVCLIQLATKEKCYLIQIKQIKNLKPLIDFLEDDKIIKIGTGLKGDSVALFKQFNLRLKSTIDLEDIFKKLSSKNQIGAKKAASIILNEKLQKSKNKKLDSENNIKGWVVDLRKNTGGNMYPMIAGLGSLVGEGNLGYFVAKNRKDTWKYENGKMGSYQYTIPPKINSSDKKIAILIGKKTRSSGEATAIAFIGKNNVKLFGQPSGGFTSANRSFRLSDGKSIALAVSFEMDRTGKEYRSEIIPDVIIQPDANKDLDLETAQKWILE